MLATVDLGVRDHTWGRVCGSGMGMRGEGIIEWGTGIFGSGMGLGTETFRSIVGCRWNVECEICITVQIQGDTVVWNGELN